MSQDSDDAPIWLRMATKDEDGEKEDLPSDDIPAWMKQYKVIAIVDPSARARQRNLV